MKITAVEAVYLRLPRVRELCDSGQDALIVKVHTDAGITGIACAVFLVAVLASGREKNGQPTPGETARNGPSTAAPTRSVPEPSHYAKRDPQPPKDLSEKARQADALLSEAKAILKSWSVTRSESDLKKARKVVEAAIQAYRSAPDAAHRYVEWRLNQANQLLYAINKSSSI